MEAAELIQLDERLRTARAPLLSRWQEIAELIAPHEADFVTRRAEGETRGLLQYESTPAVAADNLASGLWSLLTNPATDWFAIKPEAPTLLDDGDIRAWCEDVRRAMLAEFAAEGQAFYRCMRDFLRTLVRYGTAILYVDQHPATGRLRYWTPRLAECVLAEDDEGRAAIVSRRWRWTARQAFMRFGKALPRQLIEAAERTPDAEFEFLHVVRPNKRRDPRRRDAAGRAFISCYVSITGGQKIEEGGLDHMPYVIGRWGSIAGSVYGYSPAMLALADIKTLNLMAKAMLVIAQKSADPPILAVDENAIGPVRLRPGGVIYGALDAGGNRRIVPMETGASPSLTDAMIEAKRRLVEGAFLAAQLTLPDQPNRTATEILQREEDRMRLMAPNLVQVQAEVLDSLIEVVFKVMLARGDFPAPPPSLLASGSAMMVEYVSPLARAQRASEGQAILRALESVTQLASVRPEVLDNFDLDKATRRLAETLGMPADLLRDTRAVLAQRRAGQEAASAAAASAEQAQAVDMVARAAPALARAARDAENAPNVMAALGLPVRGSA